jgi:hypothetical protein
VYAGFLSIFVLDATGGGKTPGATAAALLLHLVPAALVILVTAISALVEVVGAVAFPAFGVLYVAWAWGSFRLGVSLVIADPLSPGRALRRQDRGEAPGCGQW